ncbi:poly(A) polymerase I [Georgfuchsia toluolica]|uniref:Poly(A) polymerase I n=1 Tax=Georgfuchsia toluolica TaxID=424218 RepID=A0A916J460_9PROT|nr:polynucleotide adenylyltransferase PcnB [Georgfuchsia toluolica]CAG4883550.1 poly(A) polymerase I [Georgfuchsia toluolica]
MIRKLLRRVFRRDVASPGRPVVIPLSRHGIRRDHVSSAARRTCEGLQQAGFKAYVVGGAVRDLIAGIEPKDYDVATNATPDQVRGLFRRSRIIGRRFQIVHVMFGPETIEVSTFRAAHDEDTLKDEHGRVLRDNVWGNIADDAARRDFTVNALYYDPAAETVIDYHHGVADLKAKTLRMIGDPKTRYREDPVRMLRAMRLSAKLGLSLDPAVRAPIREMADLIENVPPARVFDEMLKLLFSGHAVECVKRLRADGLHHGLLPLLDVILEQPLGEKFVMLSLESTDDRIRAGKTTSPGFLFATLLWHEVLANWQARKAKAETPIPALHDAMDEVLDQQGEKLAITRRIAGDIKDIWALQPRFDKRSGKSPWRLVDQPRFRAGYDFLVLRAQSGEIPQELADWWTEFQDASHERRTAMLLTDTAAKKPRRRKPRSKGNNATTNDNPVTHAGPTGDNGQ